MLPHEAPEGGGMMKLSYADGMKRGRRSDLTPQALFTKISGALKRIVHSNEQGISFSKRTFGNKYVGGYKVVIYSPKITVPLSEKAKKDIEKLVSELRERYPTLEIEAGYDDKLNCYKIVVRWRRDGCN